MRRINPICFFPLSRAAPYPPEVGRCAHFYYLRGQGTSERKINVNDVRKRMGMVFQQVSLSPAPKRHITPWRCTMLGCSREEVGHVATTCVSSSARPRAHSRTRQSRRKRIACAGYPRFTLRGPILLQDSPSSFSNASS